MKSQVLISLEKKTNLRYEMVLLLEILFNIIDSDLLYSGFLSGRFDCRCKHFIFYPISTERKWVYTN